MFFLCKDIEDEAFQENYFSQQNSNNTSVLMKYFLQKLKVLKNHLYKFVEKNYFRKNADRTMHHQALLQRKILANNPEI